MADETLQKFKSSLNRGVTAISVKTSSSLEKMKIKTHIESIYTDVQQSLFAVGDKAYTLWDGNAENFQELIPMFEAIKEKQLEIVSLQEAYDTIDQRDNEILGATAVAAPVCPNCQVEFPQGTKFCRQCGTKLG